MITHEYQKKIIFLSLQSLLILSLAAGCTLIWEKKPVAPGRPLILINGDEAPQFVDDLDLPSLEQTIANSMDFYARLNDDAVFIFGEQAYTAKELMESLSVFESIISSDDGEEVKQQRIIETFDIYKAAGNDDEGNVLFTGYYEPILEGSDKKTDQYRYPIYRTPDDLVATIPETCTLKNRNHCAKIISRRQEGRLVSYYSREEIDSLGVLSDRNLEIAWLSDPIDRFFLHIQGSGRIRLTKGSCLRVSYAQSNGRPYRSISAYLLKDDKITPNHLSLQNIKKYLRQHPNELEEIFNYNERYIFFRKVEKGPVGALGLVVQAGRTIATDPTMFPQGALAFIKLKRPLFDIHKSIIGWQPFSRFVLNQDEGSAIKGPGRVDIFCGTGDWAGVFAGSLKKQGELYFLVKKK